MDATETTIDPATLLHVKPFEDGIVERKSLPAFEESFDIMKKWYVDGPVIVAAEHDQIWSFLSVEDCPITSPEGKRLVELGWFEDEGAYSMYA